MPPPMGPVGERDLESGEDPSAPPLGPSQVDETASISGSRGSPCTTARLSPLVPNSTGAADQDLYDDLLRRVGGDRARADAWLSEMGFRPEEFASIPAVGSVRSGAYASMSSLASAATSKKPLLGSSAAASRQAAEEMCSPYELREKKGASAMGSTAKKDPLAVDMGAGGKESDPDTRAAEAGAPRHFFCPISCMLMRDPVMLPTGQTYDRPCIERWLAHGNSSCPMTGRQLTRPVALTPNVALRSSIQEWCAKYAPYMLDAQGQLRPVPADSQLGTALVKPSSPVADPDLAMAIQMQQAELARLAEQRAAAAVAAGRSRRGSATGNGSMRRSSSGGVGTQGGRAVRRSWRTLATVQLVAACAAYIALFLLAMAKGNWDFAPWSLNPFAGPSQSALMYAGALSYQATSGKGQWWRIASAPFVNAGIIQLVGNLGTLIAFSRYLDSVLPLPDLCLAAVYLFGAGLGGLSCVNLNIEYMACGASAGVCSLLGGVWADQIINFRRYHNRLVTWLVLLLVTLVFAAISLLPMLNIWYNMGGFVAGLLLSTALLLAFPPGGGRSGGSSGGSQPQAQPVSPHRCARFRTVRGIFALVSMALLAAWTGVAIAGVVTDFRAGSHTNVFYDSSCLRIDWWDCVPVDATSNGCRWAAPGNGTLLLTCPNAAAPLSLPASGTAASTDDESLAALCEQYCNLGGSSPAAGTAAGEASPSPRPVDSWGPTKAGRPSPSPPGWPVQSPPPLNTNSGQQVIMQSVHSDSGGRRL